MLLIRRSSLRTLAFTALAALLALPVALSAQTPVAPAVVSRITQPIDESSRVTLGGTVHPLARAANDRGAAPDGMPLDRLQIVLKRSDAQETALRQLIADMHTPGSPSYHKWLTPDQFGQQFGPSDADVATLESWLQSHGFGSITLDPGHQTLEFSGSVAQFRSTFHAAIHRYEVNGETHYANATDPQVPAALASVVGGFSSLNNFRVKRYSKTLGRAAYDPASHQATPQWTTSNAGQPYPNLALAPADFAVQYDVNPLYKAGTTGTGETIAIVNDSNINPTLVASFRTLFGLPASAPNIIIDGNDPGIDGINNPDGPNGDSIEAYLDVEWSGAVAPNATIDLVIGADTALESGLILAAEHAVEGNVAPILSLSFGECESQLGSTNVFLNQLWEQAAAQGITVLVSAGDSGSAGCDNPDTQYYAVGGQAVSGFASTPYDVAVGGTDFFYSSYNSGNSTTITSQLGQYWNLTPTNNTPTTSLLAPIPEQPWNDSQYGLDLYTVASGTSTIAAGSGGASTVGMPIGILQTNYGPYTKPSWQTGTGVPADGARDLPDVSLFAADGINASFTPICAVDGDCQPVASGGTVQITGVGGTSVAAPSFAGIMALVNQKYGAQGQADFVLYPLAKQFPAAFHDVTTGTNSVPCNVTTTGNGTAPLDCISVSNPETIIDPTYGSAVEGQIGIATPTKTAEYNAGVGYDLASGLGSIDANQLVTNWGNVKFAASNVTLNASSTSFSHGTAITINGTVTPTGTTQPTGNVALMTSSTTPLQAGQTSFPVTNGSYTGSINFLPGGTYDIWGQYSGDGTNASSTSSKTQITVTPEASSLYFNILNTASITSGYTAISAGATVPYGTQLILSGEAVPTTFYTTCLTVPTPPASCSTATFSAPTGTVTFTDSGSTLNIATVNAEGDAEFNAPFTVGTHSVAASYSGDASYNTSTAAAVAFTVAKDTPQLLFSSTAATAAVNTYQGGQPITFTIGVENDANGGSQTTYPQTRFYAPVLAPTGTVTITGLPSGVPTSATLQAALDLSTVFPEGVAAITAPATTPAGTYTVTITYSGDANYSPTSGTATVIIAAANSALSPSTTTATSSATMTSPTAGIQVTATVTGVSGKPAPTGSVLFATSGLTLGSVTLTPGSGDISTAMATLNSSNLLPGANLITVQYSGDSVYQPSSATLTLNNGPGPGAAGFALSGTTVSIASAGASGTSTLSATGGAGFSSGVTFTCAVTAGPASATSAPTCSPASAAVTAGATVTTSLTINTTSTTTSGTYTLTVYGTAGSTVETANITVTVGAASAFTLANSSSSAVSIAPGTPATATITLTPSSSGFTGSVALSCALTASPTGATDLPTCTITSPVALSGTTAGSATLTINTTAPSTAQLDNPLQRIFTLGGGATGAALAALLFFGLPIRRRNWRSLLSLLVFAAIASAVLGCGGGSSTPSTPTTPVGGTTAGSYTVTVTATATGAPSQTLAVPVTVN